MRSFLLCAAFALLVAGCGQKGPLFLRQQPPPGMKPQKQEPYRPVPYPKQEQSEKK